MAKNTPGNELNRTQKAQQELLKVTEKVNTITSFAAVGAGVDYKDGFGAIRTIIERLIEGPLFETTQELKQQGKDKISNELNKRGIPASRSEAKEMFREKILEKSCDIQVMNIVKKTKINLENILNGIDSKIESNLKKLEKFKKKTDKALESLVEIVSLLAIFQALLVALKILASALKFALIPLTGLFASAVLAEKISNAIKKAEAFVFKYVNAIQVYTGYVIATLGTVISLINLIPLIIDLLKNFQRLIRNFVDTLKRYYQQYIEGCLPGLDATDSAAIDDFLNFNTPNLDNIEPDILGDYIRDEDERRIFRPKIN